MENLFMTENVISSDSPYWENLRKKRLFKAAPEFRSALLFLRNQPNIQKT